MKDLKHLIYFEKLLEEAHNELVREAKSQGRKCLATVCENTPEPLCNLEGAFSVRLRAPRTGSLDVSTYYMTSFLCEYTRALLERAMEGGFNFADGLVTPDGCTMINRCVENMELNKAINNPDFFYEYMEIPMKADDNGLALYKLQCQNHILNPMKERWGIDISDAAIRKSVEQHNKICKVIRELGDFRKEEYPRITGYEFHIICMVSYACPQDLILDKLIETLEEVKTREPDDTKHRARVVLVGSEIDDIDMVKLVEDSGAYVCADRFCYGSLPGRDPIALNDEEDALTQVCRIYMERGQCPRYMNQQKMIDRRQYVADLVKEYNADGVIYEQMKFCDPWAYERMVGSHVIRDDFGYPVLTVDRPYAIGSSGQMRTRIQAFVESIEIKQIQGGAK